MHINIFDSIFVNMDVPFMIPSTPMNLMYFANRPIPSMEFHYIMNMTRETFMQQIKHGFLPLHYTLERGASPIPSVFYSKTDWFYNNRHLLETMSIDDFLSQGSHVDFIFREKAKAVDLELYLENMRDLAGIFSRDTCSLRLFHQLWNLDGLI